MIPISEFRVESINHTPKGVQCAGVVSTGVKVTHIATGISCVCESERSQFRNLELATSKIEAQMLKEKNAQSRPICPHCGEPLKEVLYPSDAMLNREQWESVRAGDWYCDKHPEFRYFWNELFEKEKP